VTVYIGGQPMERWVFALLTTDRMLTKLDGDTSDYKTK
jgi:hypothetical protein